MNLHFFFIIFIIINFSCKDSIIKITNDPCEENYILEEGICINSKEMSCQTPESIPNNAILIDSLVTAHYSDLSGWVIPECSWECSEGFFEENGACIDNSSDYSKYENLEDDELVLALYEEVRDHVEFTYGKARDEMYQVIDVFDGKVECIYTGRWIDGPISRQEAYRPNRINTEHSWPRGQFGQKDPALSDIIHLFPSDEDTNSGRSSYDFGIYGDIIESFCNDGICSYLRKDASDKKIFDVRPKRKGDIARAHFYMVLRYKYSMELTIDDNSGEIGCDSDGCIRDSEEEILRLWNIEDPVDERERERNERIFSIQGNRNPFVDRPDFIQKISDF